MLSLLEDPRRIVPLVRALAVLGSRRTEQGAVGIDPMGEVVCIAVESKAFSVPILFCVLALIVVVIRVTKRSSPGKTRQQA